ncbi:MAG TPA: hypothetical protein PKC70_05720, partial [Cellvibrionaceae bacterium]|nr:hypothetical protein [Cellvibrionaceae bacterium]
MTIKNIKILLAVLLLSLEGIAELPCAEATTNVLGASPQRHDRFYQGADKQFILRQYDLSGIGKVVSASSKWATMVSERFFVSSNHAHPSSGEVVRFYFSNNPADGFVDRTVAGGEQIKDSSGRAVGDLWLGYFSAPVPVNIALYPLLGSGMAYPPIDSKLILLGKANDGLQAELNPLNQRVGRNICVAHEIANHAYFYTYDPIGAADSLGVDENSVVAGDSGAPTFILIDNKLVLVGTRWGFDASLKVDIDSSVIAKTTPLAQAIARLSANSEQLRILNIPARLTGAVLLEDFEAEQLGATTLIGSPTTTKHLITGTDAGGRAEVVARNNNQQLKLTSPSDADTDSPKLFFETIATAISQGEISLRFRIDPISQQPPVSNKPILTLRAGDDIGLNQIALDGPIAQAAIQIEFTDTGHLNITTADGSLLSEQQFTFGQEHFFAIKFNLSAKNFSLYLDGDPLSANSVKQFTPISAVKKLDAIYVASRGLPNTSTTAYVDELHIDAPGGWRSLEQTLALPVLGANLENDIFSSNYWQRVANTTNSILDVGAGKANAGAWRGFSRLGINGFNSSEIAQIIDLTASGLNKDIDKGGVTATYSAAGMSEQIGDYAHLGMEFLNADKVSIDQAPQVAINDGKSRWAPLQLQHLVPAATRYLKLTAGVTRSAGITTDAYIDGLFSANLSWVKTQAILPVDVQARDLEPAELINQYWQKLSNNTGVFIEFANVGINNTGTSGVARGGISGFNRAELAQTLDLTTSPYLIDIDAGKVFINASALGISYQVGDYAQLKLEFFDNTGILLATSPIVAVNDGQGQWAAMKITEYKVPIKTRKVRLVIGLTRS